MTKLNTEWNLAGLENSSIESGAVQFIDAGQGPAVVVPIIWNARTLIALT